jgi:hypothetical protein
MAARLDMARAVVYTTCLSGQSRSRFQKGAAMTMEPIDQAKKQPPADETSSVKDLLGSVAGGVSMVTAISFLLSIIYEQAYFSVVGQKFQNIASLSDYLTNVLDWLPAVVGALAAYMFLAFPVFAIIFRHIQPHTNSAGSPNDQQASHDDSDQTNQVRDKKGDIRAGITLLVLGVLMISALFVSDPKALFVVSGGFIGIWFGLIMIADGLGALNFLGANGKNFLQLVPVALVLVFLWGLYRGYSDLNSPVEPYTLIGSQVDVQGAEKVRLLRVFDRGILVRWPEQQLVEFLQWDQVRSIKLQRDGAEARKSLLCHLSGWVCGR